MPKKTKNTKRKQKGKGQVEESYKKVSEWYGPRFEDWLATPSGQAALQRKNEYGDSSKYDDFKAVYEMRIPGDIVEATRPYYRNPKTDTKVGKWLRDNSTPLLKAGFKTVANIIGVPGEIGSAVGGLIGDALDKANQEGGSKHMRRPMGKAPQHGSGATVYRTRPYPIKTNIYVQPRIPQMGGASPFLLNHNSGFNSVKF